MNKELFEVVELEPLPEHLLIDEIELDTESHWTITLEYIYNRLINGLGNSQYVIGLTKNGNPREITAIGIDGRYYSPLVKESKDFLVLHTIDSDRLLSFYDVNYRPFCLADFDNKYEGAL